MTARSLLVLLLAFGCLVIRLSGPAAAASMLGAVGAYGYDDGRDKYDQPAVRVTGLATLASGAICRYDDRSNPTRVRCASAPSSLAAKGLPDEALVVRGGENTAERFAGGSGVTLDEAGRLHGVSVNSGAGRSLRELTEGIPNKQVGVTTVGDVRKAGGYVRRDPLPDNPFHCLMGGCTPQQFSDLFTPTIKNPWTG